MKSLNRFQKWAILTTGATYFLIMVGAFVRAAGAGLGCPDWPKCFDRWIPPTDISQVPAHIDPEKFNFALAWIEYINRLIGVSIGIFIFVTLILAIKNYRKTPRVLWPTFGAFIGVIYEGWLGSKVVASELMPRVVTAHMLVALLIVSLLLYATVCAFFPDGKPLPNLSKGRKNFGRFLFFGLVILLFQIGLGSMVRGNIELFLQNFPELNASIWFEKHELIDILHRNFAIVVSVYIFVVSLWIWKKYKLFKSMKVTTIILILLLIVQLAGGLGMVYGGLPPFLQVIHLIAGSLMMGALTVLLLLTYRLPE